jgi:hypothetical protein
MKVNVIFSLDIDIAYKLAEEKNRSALINSYLRHYYNLNKEEKKESGNEQNNKPN